MAAIASQGSCRQDHFQDHFIDVKCLICGGGHVAILASTIDIEAQLRILKDFHRRRRIESQTDDLADRAEFTQDYSTQVVQCRTCGFIYRSPRPVTAAITSTYAREQYSAAHLQTEFEAQRRWANTKASMLTRWLPAKRKPSIIEVGSFVGGFLAAGQQRGWTILGVDPGKQVAEFCLARGLAVHCGTLADAPIAPKSVDAVVIWNTFDQLPNPDITLGSARQMLQNEGVLVIRVPNGLLYCNATKVLKRKSIRRNMVIATLAWNNLLGFPYLHGYSIATLDLLLERHGFRRRRIYLDTLLPLADQHTKLWARWEERAVKWGCRILAAQPFWFTDQWAPWVDLYYGLRETSPNTPISVATQHFPHESMGQLASFVSRQ